MAAYADFTFYTGTYLGNAITSTNFPRLALRASAEIDKITFGRAAAETDLTIIENIKMTCCAVAEEIQALESDGAGISSEKIGTYQVTYNDKSKAAQGEDQRFEGAARLYLENTGLLFKGFVDGEYANH